MYEIDGMNYIKCVF